MNPPPGSHAEAASEPGPAPWAVGLGHLALLPFLAGAAAAWLGSAAIRPLAQEALSAYAAVVVSFIGAIHWGLAFPQARPAPSLLVWGVLPSLAAWAALLLAPAAGLLVHALVLAACYAVDRVVYPRERVARWLPLRLRLTAVAVLCCLGGAAAMP